MQDDKHGKLKETLDQYVFDILDERKKHAGKTMAQLYDPDKKLAGLLIATSTK